MDNRNPFERQLADESDYEVGPPRNVDALAITQQAKSTSPRWRFLTMSGTIKFTAAATVLATAGAAFLLVAPGGLTSDDGAVAPPGATEPTAAAQDDSAAPALVRGTIARERDDSAGTTSFVDGAATFDGFRDTDRWEADDTRLEGTSTYESNWREYPASGFLVEAGTYVLENDGGRWVGTSTGLFGGEAAVDTVILQDEDGSEGLTAYVVIEWGTGGECDAAIFTGGLPLLPEAPNE